MPAHKGSAHHLAVLTEDSVRTARTEYRLGATVKDLADRYHVTPGAMRRALHGVTWKHLDAPEVPDAA